MDPIGFTIQNVDEHDIEAFFAVADFGTVNEALEAAYETTSKEDGGFEESYIRAIYPSRRVGGDFSPLALIPAKKWKFAPASLVAMRNGKANTAELQLDEEGNYKRKFQCKVCHPYKKARSLEAYGEHTFFGNYAKGGCKLDCHLFDVDDDDEVSFYS